MIEVFTADQGGGWDTWCAGQDPDPEPDCAECGLEGLVPVHHVDPGEIEWTFCTCPAGESLRDQETTPLWVKRLRAVTPSDSAELRQVQSAYYDLVDQGVMR